MRSTTTSGISKLSCGASNGKVWGGTQALLTVLESVKMISRPWKDPSTGELLGIFLTDPQAVVLAQKYAYVLQMDCTSKTNKYNMPLLHIVSHTATNATFTVGYCFMKQETAQYYAQALRCLLEAIPDIPTEVVVTDAEIALHNALKAVCPTWIRLLCRWHITQNIKANCRTGLLQEEWALFLDVWNEIVYSRSSGEYRAAGEKFQRLFDGQTSTQHLFDYVCLRLEPEERDRYVGAWVDEYPHLGSTSSSRAEGAHSHAKRKLHSCRGNLHSTVKVLRSNMVDQQMKIFKEMNAQILSPPVMPDGWFAAVSVCLNGQDGARA